MRLSFIGEAAPTAINGFRLVRLGLFLRPTLVTLQG